MKRLLTFCGTGRYTETTYHWDAKEYPTAMLPCGLAEWLKPDAIHVGITPEAATHENWQRLQESLPAAIGLPIPNGDQPGDEWKLLEAVAAICEPGDVIWIDVTHGFRALPMLMLVSVFYLQMTRKVEVGGILYGAFQPKRPERTPVVDLTGIVDLMRWLQAAQSFRDTVDASALSSLLEGIHRQAWMQRVPGGAAPRKLQSFAGSLRRTGQAFRANQPLELARNASCLLGELNEAENELRSWAAPFALLLDQMRGQIDCWQQSDLQAMRRLVRHYFELDLLMQAAFLAREWVVCAVLVMRGETDLVQRDSRMLAENMLNQMCKAKQPKGIREPILEETHWLESQAVSKHLAGVWNLNPTRNTLAHCGQQSQPIPLDKLKANVQKMIEHLEAIPLDQLAPPNV